MDLQWIQQNWALAAALILLSIVGVVIAAAVRRQSSAGLLGSRVQSLRSVQRERRAAELGVMDVQRKLDSLERKADKVRPRELEEARGRLRDAEALLKIACDREMVEANKLRKVIYEEFAPARQEILRQRYLPNDAADARPLSY